MTVRLTVGMPVYNGERYVAQALRALLDQDVDGLEVLVGDNASDDATPRIVADFAADDPRVRVLRHVQNIGGARNSNALLDQADGTYFKWAYHDDLCDPGCLAALVATLDADPTAVAAYPHVVRIDEEGAELGRYEDDVYLDVAEPSPHQRLATVLGHKVWPVQFGLFRTAAVREAGGTCVSTAGEFVMPASLALRGAAHPVAPAVQRMREHTARAGGGRRSEAVWVDPSRPHVPFPYARSVPLLLAAVRAAGLSQVERCRCIAAVHRNWTLPNWQMLAGDLVRLPWDLGWVGR